MKVYKEPMVHFLILAMAVFAIYAAVAPPAPPAPEVIVLTAQDGERLRAQFRASRGRDPDAAEFRDLVDNDLREEILYREALALGLNDNDQVIRLRMRQKMEFLLADAAALPAPTEHQLRQHYEKTKAQYSVPGTVSFAQVYLGPAPPDPAALAAALSALRAGADPAQVGVAGGLFPAEIAMARQTSVDNLFGAGFFTRLDALPQGEWTGPVTSGYGAHLVLVTARQPARAQDLAEVRDQVAADWRRIESARLAEAAYGRLKARYRIDLAPLGLEP